MYFKNIVFNLIESFEPRIKLTKEPPRRVVNQKPQNKLYCLTSQAIFLQVNVVSERDIKLLDKTSRSVVKSAINIATPEK